ncbi:MAG: hypothetical protein M1423_10030 [Acidobacteria bacterium]|nr:hypothetical protein [Acidobacteriota bacterium]
MAIDFIFDPGRHLYLVQGRPVPSVTQVLHSAALSADYAAVEPEVLERKRIIGEYVHKATQYLDEGSLDLGTVDPQIQPYLAAYEKFMKGSGFRPWLIERRLVGTINGMLCGGTVDLEGTMAGRPWIIDLKCIERLYPSFGLQTAGYELLLPKPVTPPFRYTRAILQLRPDGSYKLTTYDDPADFDVFRAALAVTAWKMNHNMSTRLDCWSEVDEAA